MRIFNVGIIGYGGFGKFLHHHWSKLPQARVVAVADPLIQPLPGLTKTFADWHDLLREQEIDLIAIATVPSTHAEIATACMEAGKHVLIEKPLAINLADARKIIAVRDRTNSIAAIDFIMRFNPLLQAIQDLSWQNVFGILRRVDVENYAQDEQLPMTHWFWDREQSGGILIEHGVHFIDLVHFLAPANHLTVNGLKFDRSPNQEDRIMANVLYEGGLMATHYHAFSRPGFFEATKIKLSYDLADIELFGWIPLRAEINVLVNSRTRKALEASPFFEIGRSVAVEQAADQSRPAGWGASVIQIDSNRHFVRSGGIEYEVDEMISCTMDIKQSKEAVYAHCVQESLLDVLKKVNDPDHRLSAPLEVGMDSLDIAIQATKSAHTSQ